MGSSKIGRFCGKAFPKNGNLLTITHQIYIWLRLFDPKPNTGFELSWTSATPSMYCKIRHKFLMKY